MIHPADRERWRAESARVMADRDSFALEYRIVSRDGQVKWLHDEAHLERDEMNRPRYWRGVISDVTERKRVEQALADSEELHRGVVEMSPDAIFVGVEGRFEFVNAAMVRLLGASDPSELLGRAVMDFVHPDYHELVRDKMIAVKQGAEAPIASEKYVRLDGTEVDVEVAAIALTYRGKPAGLVLARDVTERGRTEEQLRQAEAKYRALVEQLPAIVYMAEFEEAGDWLYVSPQIESILGFTPQEWTADPTLFDQRIHPDDEAQYRADEARSRTSGGPLSSEYRMVARDGREVWIRDEAFVVRDDSGRPLLHQGVMFDVTQNKLAEQALRDGLEREHEASERLRSLDEMRNAFLHAVSHELRTPLTSVMGFALTLSRKDVTISDADRADMLDRLAANARKLERLLSDLLDVDRLARGILEPKLYPTDVAELARRVVSETEVGRRDVRIEGTARAHVDGPKVERILENLLVNSARHTPEGSTVWVRLSQTDDGVQIAVDDDGPGVPDALKQDIFEPFHQGQSSNTHAPGTGIGLSLVARFAELHGGRAWVEDRPGGGASFRVSIPSGDLGTVEPQPLRPAPEVDEDAVPRRERGVA
jgi:PAS domain S-box-containing protein